jgi:hypothetical protein
MARMTVPACSVRSFQCSTANPGRLDDVAQFGGGGEVAEFGSVGPGQRIVQLAGSAGGDIPEGESAAGDEHPARFPVQTGLVGHVHLDVLADDDIEGGVGERQLCDVALMYGDRAVEPDTVVEPPRRLAVLLGQVDRRDVAAVLIGEKPRRSASVRTGCSLRQISDPPENRGCAGWVCCCRRSNRSKRCAGTNGVTINCSSWRAKFPGVRLISGPVA